MVWPLAGLAFCCGGSGALAGGPASYQSFIDWVWLGPCGRPADGHFALLGKVVLVGLTWAFFQHMATGIRHFIHGYRLGL